MHQIGEKELTEIAMKETVKWERWRATKGGVKVRWEKEIERENSVGVRVSILICMWGERKRVKMWGNEVYPAMSVVDLEVSIQINQVWTSRFTIPC